MSPRTGPAREMRLAAALRENLKRRKAQARVKAQDSTAAGLEGSDAALPPADRPKAASNPG
jgi:hypothetical protein